MDKHSFVKKIANETGFSMENVNKVLNTAVKVIVTEVRDNNENITLPGLGTFKQKVSVAREGYNPSTGKKMQIAESCTIGFKAQPSVRVKSEN